MFLAAITFVICALSCPTLGSVFYIGPFRSGANVWRKFYAAYVIVMCALFIASFFSFVRLLSITGFLAIFFLCLWSISFVMTVLVLMVFLLSFRLWYISILYDVNYNQF